MINIFSGEKVEGDESVDIYEAAQVIGFNSLGVFGAGNEDSNRETLEAVINLVDRIRISVKDVEVKEKDTESAADLEKDAA